tara:strand:- start:1470 stop:1628 length:159 start_codon:yes stop_codon:yes gene_type:complete
MEEVTLLQVIGWSLFIGLACIGALTLMYLSHNWILDRRDTKRRKTVWEIPKK